MSKLTNEEFLQRLQDKNIKYVPLEEYVDSHTKIKWLCYKNNKHIFESKPSHILDGHGCPYCSGHKVFVGENDLWTTHPEVARMLDNQDEGYMYASHSHHKTNWRCLGCGTMIKDKTIKNVTEQGLSCSNCSDARSYAEKIMISILNQMSLDFSFNKTFKWSGRKRYDFYIPYYNLIIETHGEQHYTESFAFKNGRKRSLQDEINNDNFKKELAIKNGISVYISLDCSKSNLNFIKSSILNSELNNIFDLSCIDWEMCHLYTLTSLSNQIIDLWNSGMKNTTKISNYLGIGRGVVLDKLKIGNELGLCDFVKNSQKKRNNKPVLCVEIDKVYEKIQDVRNEGFWSKYITMCCYGEKETAYGFHWQFIENN